MRKMLKGLHKNNFKTKLILSSFVLFEEFSFALVCVCVSRAPFLILLFTSFFTFIYRKVSQYASEIPKF